jgi:hypothetical protein
MANVELFTHNPLPVSTSYRLVRLLHTAGEGSPAFEISEHETGYLPCYSALSYRWGSDSTLQEISLSGKRFQVRQNLWHFLNQLYLGRDCSYYWIDALCINQNDLIERNNYVFQVGEVYRNAQRVLIWLGHYQTLESCFAEMVESRKSTYLSEEDDATRSIARSNLCSTVLKMQYWSRAWIVQEILLARTVVLKCLSQHLSIEYLYQYCLEHMIPQPDLWRLERAWTLLQNVAVARTVRPFDWLFYIADQECADHRDKAYSFLGLYSHRFRNSQLSLSMDIDYRKDVATVYWDCVYKLLASRKELSDEVVKQRALSLRRWLELVLGLTPIENVQDTDTSYLSLLDAYVCETSLSDRHRELAEVTLIISIAFGLVWSTASTFLPFRSLVFACYKTHIDTDMRGAALLVPSNHAADGSPVYHHLTSMAQSHSPAKWQCLSCFRYVGDFFLSQNQLINEDSDKIPMMRTKENGKTKQVLHHPFTIYPWHERIVNCADCSFIEFTIVRQLRAACTKRMDISIQGPTIPGATEPPYQSDGYDTIFSPEERYFYYQASHLACSVLVLWITPGLNLSISRDVGGMDTEGNLQGSSQEPKYIWFTAKNPESREGCHIRACSPSQRSMSEPTRVKVEFEKLEADLEGLEELSSEGTDGESSPKSNNVLAEQLEKELPEEKEEGLSPENQEMASANSKQESLKAQDDLVSTEQAEATNPEDEVLYTDSFVGWLTRSPPKKPSLPLQPQWRHHHQ